MVDYSTAQEKAVEWDVSVRHVQYLCKRGKIDGAIKKAGTWFIPCDILSPIQNTKSNVKDFKFVGTKRKIFAESIRLFMRHGYDATSIKDVAKEVGIAQSAVYNHFKTKKEILDTIYDFFAYFFNLNRPKLEDVEPILREGSLTEIMACTWYSFNDEYEQEISDITRIIFQRNSVDERAKEITKSLIIDAGIDLVKSFFDRAVELGRLAPFDTRSMAVFIMCTRITTLNIWIIDPSREATEKTFADEMKLHEYATRLLTDLKSSSESDRPRKI